MELMRRLTVVLVFGMMFNECTKRFLSTSCKIHILEDLFHQLINHRLGGGDQIYNDGIRVNGPLRPWTDIGIPKKRREYPFPEELRKKCDDYYVNNYIKW